MAVVKFKLNMIAVEVYRICIVYEIQRSYKEAMNRSFVGYWSDGAEILFVDRRCIDSVDFLTLRGSRPIYILD